MKKSHQLYAKRKALQVFDEWVDVTGFVQRHSGYYDEICGIIETAVDIGSLVALEVPFHINDDGEAVEEHPFESGTYDGVTTPLSGEMNDGWPLACMYSWLTGQIED